MGGVAGGGVDAGGVDGCYVSEVRHMRRARGVAWWAFGRGLSGGGMLMRNAGAGVGSGRSHDRVLKLRMGGSGMANRVGLELAA